MLASNEQCRKQPAVWKNYGDWKVGLTAFAKDQRWIPLEWASVGFRSMDNIQLLYDVQKLLDILRVAEIQLPWRGVLNICSFVSRDAKLCGTNTNRRVFFTNLAFCQAVLILPGPIDRPADFGGLQLHC